MDVEVLVENRVVVGCENSKLVVSCGWGWLGDEIVIVDLKFLVRCL